eukprot:2497630-Pyramimonas_sp.AAC.1
MGGRHRRGPRGRRRRRREASPSSRLPIDRHGEVDTGHVDADRACKGVRMGAWPDIHLELRTNNSACGPRGGRWTCRAQLCAS